MTTAKNNKNETKEEYKAKKGFEWIKKKRKHLWDKFPQARAEDDVYFYRKRYEKYN